ncbi:hypothetical protein KFL_010900030 [Klebsormidium nitens]|uniref:Reverse transcriptase Ty1/copia-type domain-containing protein n=1 Tax=Klebsormidium nitens TaxID=105231 RepID=A0A1Y1IPS2_KLENI|nr:hypothetical protein KFL_010900030 [Klebsormidium nitens]|eukprot:GAQ92673.1 hypothetical protein KFL_010900030 [Klebsormidium nitens]
MKQPEGYEQSGPNLVCHLKRILYGLRQAPRMWHTQLKGELGNFEFVAFFADAALFVGVVNKERIYLVVGSTMAARGTERIAKVKTHLADKFDVRDLGKATSLLGMELARDRPTRPLKLPQKKLTGQLVRRHGLGGARARSVPLSAGEKLTREALSAPEKELPDVDEEELDYGLSDEEGTEEDNAGEKEEGADKDANDLNAPIARTNRLDLKHVEVAAHVPGAPAPAAEGNRGPRRRRRRGARGQGGREPYGDARARLKELRVARQGSPVPERHVAAASVPAPAPAPPCGPGPALALHPQEIQQHLQSTLAFAFKLGGCQDRTSPTRAHPRTGAARTAKKTATETTATGTIAVGTTVRITSADAVGGAAMAVAVAVDATIATK